MDFACDLIGSLYSILYAYVQTRGGPNIKPERGCTGECTIVEWIDLGSAKCVIDVIQILHNLTPITKPPWYQILLDPTDDQMGINGSQ